MISLVSQRTRRLFAAVPGATPLGHGDRRTQTWRHRPDACVLGPLARALRIHQGAYVDLRFALPTFAPWRLTRRVGVRNGTYVPVVVGCRPGGREDGEPIAPFLMVLVWW